MEERYIKAIDPEKWIRPAGWPALPNLTSADNKFTGVYAVFEGKTNTLSISHNSASGNNTIDWGDGTTVTWTGTGLQNKTFNYSTISAPVLKNKAGANYKPILIQYQLNSGTAGNLVLANTSTTAGVVVQSMWLDFLISWPTTFGWTLRPRQLQRLNVLKGPGNANLATQYSNLSDLRVLEGTILGPSNTNNYSTVQTAFIGMGAAILGNLEVNRVGTGIPASGLFQSSNIIKVGNITFTNTSNNNSMFSSCTNLKEVGNISMIGCTSISSLFAACTNLTKIGTIDIGSTSTIANLFTFNGCINLLEIVFVNAVRLTTATDMFLNCIRLRKLRLPNMAITFSIIDCDMERDALVQLFNDLATVATIQTITITGNPGVSDLTAADYAILTGKNWGYIN